MKIKKPPPPPLPELKKGTLLMIKAPPYYEKEYLYEVLSAGTKLVRASLYHSPTVRKHWTKEELQVLFENGIIRLAGDNDVKAPTSETQTQPDSED